jgi:hypothetical protein
MIDQALHHGMLHLMKVWACPMLTLLLWLYLYLYKTWFYLWWCWYRSGIKSSRSPRSSANHRIRTMTFCTLSSFSILEYNFYGIISNSEEQKYKFGSTTSQGNCFLTLSLYPHIQVLGYYYSTSTKLLISQGVSVFEHKNLLEFGEHSLWAAWHHQLQAKTIGSNKKCHLSDRGTHCCLCKLEGEEVKDKDQHVIYSYIIGK